MYGQNVGCSRVKHFFKFASSKMGAVFTVESPLRFDICFHLEYAPNILTYDAYPEEFQYNYNGRSYHYTPAFKVVSRTQEIQLLEVKKLSDVVKEKFRLKFSVQQARAHELGCALILVTEKNIRVNPLLNNLKLVHRYSGVVTFSEPHYEILALLKNFNIVSVAELIAHTGKPEGVIVATTLSLIASNHLSANLTEAEFGLNSDVWRLL